MGFFFFGVKCEIRAKQRKKGTNEEENDFLFICFLGFGLGVFGLEASEGQNGQRHVRVLFA